MIALNQHPKQTFFGLLFFISALLVSLVNDILIKYLCSSCNTIEVTMGRAVCSIIILLPFTLTQGIFTSNLSFHFLRSILFFLSAVLWSIGLSELPLATVITLGMIRPCWVMLFAFFILNESISVKHILLYLIAFLGAMLCLVNSNISFSSFYGIGIVILSTVGFAFLEIFTKKKLTQEPIFQILLYLNIFTFLFAGICNKFSFSFLEAHTIHLFMGLGIGTTLLSFFLLKAYSKLEISFLAPFKYVEVVLSYLLGYFIFYEVPAMIEILGTVLIISANLFLFFSKVKRQT